jgi:hypothetical protein
MHVCIRKTEGFAAVLIANGQGYTWVEPAILDGKLCFPSVPRVYEFAPETAGIYNDRESAVQAAREAGGQVNDFVLRRDALDYLDGLGLLVKGRCEEWILDGQGFRETSFRYF